MREKKREGKRTGSTQERKTCTGFLSLPLTPESKKAPCATLHSKATRILAGLLTCSRIRRTPSQPPDTTTESGKSKSDTFGLLTQARTHSSGYCSGFSPDSLFIGTNRAFAPIPKTGDKSKDYFPKHLILLLYFIREFSIKTRIFHWILAA